LASVLAAATLVLLCGCTTRRYTNTPRTALEQLLLSGAVDRALAKFDVPELHGRKVFVDLANVLSVDAEYVKTATRARFAQIGAILVGSADDADYVAEVACGALGTEFKKHTLGIPKIPMPGSPTSFPELPIYQGVEQTGLMKLLIFVHAKGRFVASGHYYAKADRDESFLLFFRIQWQDDVRTGWERADAAARRTRAARPPDLDSRAPAR